MSDTLRIMLASDMMLGRPLSGLAEWPSYHYMDLIEAPYVAAERVFDAAAERDADLLILAGNIIDADEAIPRTIQFLEQQLQRMAERSIPVVYAEGRHDQFDEWPSGVLDGKHVRRVPLRGDPVQLSFSSDRQAIRFERVHRDRTDTAHAQASTNDERRIGLSTAGASHLRNLAAGFDLICVAGRRAYESTRVSRVPVICAGTTQVRSPGLADPGGAVLIELSGSSCKTARVTTGAVEFISETIPLPPGENSGRLEERLSERCLELIDGVNGRFRIVQFLVNVPADIYVTSDWDAEEARLLETLRSEFGESSSRVWTYRVSFRVGDSPPATWYDEDSIRGEFLRALRQVETDMSQPLECDTGVDHHLIKAAHDAARLSRESARQRLLKETMDLGLRLLRR